MLRILYGDGRIIILDLYPLVYATLLRGYMNYRLNPFILFVFVVSSTILWANPDVIFSDSADYNGTYLRHELKGSKIKFLLSGSVSGMTLPDEFFSADALIDFLEHKYVFTNENLKREFLLMFRMSIESKFTLQEFMSELLKFLTDFKRGMHDSDSGCSTTSTTSTTGFLSLFCMFLYFVRKTSKKDRQQILP